MFFGIGGNGTTGFRIIRNAYDGLIFGVLKAAGKGAVGSKSIRNALDSSHFLGFGCAREGAVGFRNHKKRIGLSSFSCLWKLVEGARVAPKS